MKLAAVERAEDLVECFECTGELEIGELGADAVAQGARCLLHRASSARRAYAASGRRSTAMDGRGEGTGSGVLRMRRSGASTSE